MRDHAGRLARAGGAAALLVALVTAGVLAAGFLYGEDAGAAKRKPLSTLWAVVKDDGTLVRGKGATGSSVLSTGDYRVNFNRDVSGCAYAATLDGARPGEISVFKKEVGGNETTPRQVAVATRNSAGTVVNAPFHLIVRC